MKAMLGNEQSVKKTSAGFEKGCHKRRGKM